MGSSYAPNRGLPTGAIRGVATSEQRRFSIGTWNMDHWKRSRQQREKAWEYLRTQSGTDVMLLQESVAAPDLSQSQFVHREISGYRPWGSSVVAFSEGTSVQEIDAVRTRYGAKRFSMLGTLPGTVIVAQAEVPGIGPITCVSIYGLIDVYAQTTMLRIVADLIPLFDSRFGGRSCWEGILTFLPPAAKMNRNSRGTRPSSTRWSPLD